jgi:hypothetical protein
MRFIGGNSVGCKGRNALSTPFNLGLPVRNINDLHDQLEVASELTRAVVTLLLRRSNATSESMQSPICGFQLTQQLGRASDHQARVVTTQLALAVGIRARSHLANRSKKEPFDGGS